MARHPAEVDAERRARPRRRPHARRSPRRPAPTSSTATGCGTTSRASRTTRRCGTSTASASCPGRRACGSTRPASGCRCRCSPASTPSAPSSYLRSTGHDHSWFVLTQSDHREGVRALGQRAEPRPDGQEHPRAAAAAPRQGRDRAGRGVQDQGRRLRRRGHPRRAVRRHAQAVAEGRRARHRRRSAARSRRATASSTTTSPRTRRSPPSAAPASTSATSSSGWRSRTRSSTRRTGR